MRHPAIEHELRWNRETLELPAPDEQQLVIYLPADEADDPRARRAGRGQARLLVPSDLQLAAVIALHRAAGLTAAADPPRGSPTRCLETADQGVDHPERVRALRFSRTIAVRAWGAGLE